MRKIGTDSRTGIRIYDSPGNIPKGVYNNMPHEFNFISQLEAYIYRGKFLILCKYPLFLIIGKSKILQTFYISRQKASSIAYLQVC